MPPAGPFLPQRSWAPCLLGPPRGAWPSHGSRSGWGPTLGGPGLHVMSISGPCAKWAKKKHGSSRITTIHHSIFLRFFGYCGNFCPFFFLPDFGHSGFFGPHQGRKSKPKANFGGTKFECKEEEGANAQGGRVTQSSIKGQVGRSDPPPVPGVGRVSPPVGTHPS